MCGQQLLTTEPPGRATSTHLQRQVTHTCLDQSPILNFLWTHFTHTCQIGALSLFHETSCLLNLISALE
uniref:Uncharacterized protein n=1 Tax=Arundo donax TaxID=35708 RepID=A0A0A9CDR1_ARUDO